LLTKLLLPLPELTRLLGMRKWRLRTLKLRLTRLRLRLIGQKLLRLRLKHA